MEDTEDNLVRIGKKPAMNYVVACLTLFNKGINEIVLRARGRAISTAVDVVELLRRAFISNLVVNSVEIGTEEVGQPDGRKTSVSTIEIKLGKKPSQS